MSADLTPADLPPVERAKYSAARRAVDFVQDGMKLGLGTGSTAAWMVRCLAERMKAEGLRVKATATSTRTAELARSLGIEIFDLNDLKWLDLTIDGADEFDPNFNLIKGGGAALLQEKIVASASDQMIVIADAGKAVDQLGAFPLPVEVIPFGWKTTQNQIEELLRAMDVDGQEIALRLKDDAPLKTDESNYILDLKLKRIGNPRALAAALNQIAGVVENGLFIDICDTVVLGHEDGSVRVLDLAIGGEAASGEGYGPVNNIFTDEP